MLHPLYDKVILKIINFENNKSNIFIPNNNNKLCKGKILYKGNGKLLDNGKFLPLSVNIGDIVLFNKNLAHNINIVNNNYFIIKESDLLAIIK